MGYSPWGHKESDSAERLHYSVALEVVLWMHMSSWPKSGWRGPKSGWRGTI